MDAVGESSAKCRHPVSTDRASTRECGLRGTHRQCIRILWQTTGVHRRLRRLLVVKQETRFDHYVEQILAHAQVPGEAAQARGCSHLSAADAGRGEVPTGQKGRVVLIGASMGGMLALKAARRIEESAPKSLAALVLVCSTIPANCLPQSDGGTAAADGACFPLVVPWSQGSYDSTKRSMPDSSEEVSEDAASMRIGKEGCIPACVSRARTRCHAPALTSSSFWHHRTTSFSPRSYARAARVHTLAHATHFALSCPIHTQRWGRCADSRMAGGAMSRARC